MTQIATNPHTGAELERHEVLDDQALQAALADTDAAARAWRATDMQQRTARALALAGVLRERVDAAARQMALEMGKPIRAGRAEIEKCAWLCEHYAEHAPGDLADLAVPTDAHKSYIAWRPLGVVLAVMPWNYPWWQVLRFAVPALLVGNGAVLKHAANVPGCALAIQDAFEEAGFPEGLFRTLIIGRDAVESVIADRRVHAVTLTGSTGAGRAVAAAAGQHLKKTVLELGGSDPYVLLEDADVAHAADVCATARLTNGGQSCIAAKRFIVPRGLVEAFTARIVARFEAVQAGDPLDESTELGPMARADLRDELHEQVERSVAAGARLLVGGTRPDGPGAHYPATVLADVAPGMAAFDEELFGPVASIVPADDDAHALELANASPFGLGAAVFTRDVERGERIARDVLAAGCCFVNAQVKSDPRLPFGGIGDSGYGRELGTLGLREFVNAKTVWVDTP